MGVLEDAIREHLDLKRRHGATDEELTRQEAEALGPARRGAPESAEAEDTEAPEAADATEVAPAEVERPSTVEEPELPEVEAEPEPPDAALPTAGPEAPPAPADQDTVMYSPGEAPDAPEHDEDPDFGSDPPERRPPGDFDFD
jgi:hypothetical protein